MRAGENSEDIFGSDPSLGETQIEADRSIADALERQELLSTGEVERVFHRALELEAEAVEQPHLFTPEQIERIAAEIGMDVAFVRQALSEVRMTSAARSRLERWILPDPITAAQSVEGIDRDELDTLIDDWMRGYEGLVPAETLPDGIDWDVDRRWSARARAARLRGGNRMSRRAGGDIGHRVQSLSDDEHVVSLSSSGNGPLWLAKLALILAGGLVGVGLIGGLSAATVTQFVQTLAVFGLSGLATAAAGVALARRWAGSIGRSLRRSLTGLVERLSGTRRQPTVELKPLVRSLLEQLTAQVRANAERAQRSRHATGRGSNQPFRPRPTTRRRRASSSAPARQPPPPAPPSASPPPPPPPNPRRR